jgi:hypothetical protein
VHTPPFRNGARNRSPVSDMYSADRYRCDSRLFGDDQLVKLGRSVLVVLLVPQNGGITLFDELLRHIAARSRATIRPDHLCFTGFYAILPVSASVSDSDTFLLVIIAFLWFDIVDVYVDRLSNELFTQESVTHKRNRESELERQKQSAVPDLLLGLVGVE